MHSFTIPLLLLFVPIAGLSTYWLNRQHQIGARYSPIVRYTLRFGSLIYLFFLVHITQNSILNMTLIPDVRNYGEIQINWNKSAIWETISYRVNGYSISPLEQIQRISRKVSLIPFQDFVKTVSTAWYVKYIVGNFMLLSPLGFFIAFGGKSEWKTGLKVGFLGALLIECGQLLNSIFLVGNRVFSIDDVWMNSVGCFGGYIATKLVLTTLQKLNVLNRSMDNIG